IGLDHAGFSDDALLQEAVHGADAVLHFAGVNRGTDADVERMNPAISQRLVEACKIVGNETVHIVYANSIHAESDTPYGRSKRLAGEILRDYAPSFTDLILPHIFG